MRISSQDLYQQSQKHMPGGVNSPVRAFQSVGGTPVFINNAKGAYLYSVEQKAYIDLVCSWGAVILGHADQQQINDIQQQLVQGLSYGAPTEAELQMAKKIQEFMPGAEKVRMTNSGTEAVMSAIRLARGVTGRNRILKFTGTYHGHADALLVQSGSGGLTLGIPNSAGVTTHAVEDTLTASFNDANEAEQVFQQYAGTIAAVIIEPIAGNMGFVRATPDFLQRLRELCDLHKSLLIFDEVMTGFRVASGGVQELVGIRPDITTLGKVIGGGLPVGALTGSAEIMDHLAPSGPVYQAGTLSGNPVAMRSGLAVLQQIQDAPDFYTQLNQQSLYLTQGLKQLAEHYGLPLLTDSAGGMWGFFFTKSARVTNLAEVQQADQHLFRQFFHHMLELGVYLPPSMFEACFISRCHDRHIMDTVLNKAEDALKALRSARP